MVRLSELATANEIHERDLADPLPIGSSMSAPGSPTRWRSASLAAGGGKQFVSGSSVSTRSPSPCSSASMPWSSRSCRGASKGRRSTR